jgi:plasmid maintenance system killer protein
LSRSHQLRGSDFAVAVGLLLALIVARTLKDSVLSRALSFTHSRVDGAGQWAMAVNARRLHLLFLQIGRADAHDVEIVDYHRDQTMPSQNIRPAS